MSTFFKCFYKESPYSILFHIIRIYIYIYICYLWSSILRYFSQCHVCQPSHTHSSCVYTAASISISITQQSCVSPSAPSHQPLGLAWNCSVCWPDCDAATPHGRSSTPRTGRPVGRRRYMPRPSLIGSKEERFYTYKYIHRHIYLQNIRYLNKSK